MPRKRIVFGPADYDKVASLWLKQTQEEARTKPGKSREGIFLTKGRMWFKGKIIYSYEEHFPIARIIDDRTVLLTTREYPCPMRNDGRISPTTRLHVEKVANACKRACKKLIWCADPVGGPAANIRHWTELLNAIRNRLYVRRRPIIRESVKYSWDKDGSWAERGVLKRSDDNSIEYVLTRLHVYVNHFCLRSRFLDELKDFVRGKKSPGEIAREIVDEIVLMREASRRAKDRERKERLRLKRQINRELRARQKLLELKRLTERVKPIPPSIDEPEELFGLPGRRIAAHRKGLRLMCAS